jgi:hypothetical protein
MSTIASNTERGSCESAEARLNGNRRIWKWLERIDRPRAQRRRPPSVAGTGAKAFNAPAMFSPNPTVTGNATGSTHPSNATFRSFIPQISKSTAKHSATDEMSHRGVPRGSQDQRTVQPSHMQRQTLEQAHTFPAPDPRASTHLPREELGKSQRFNCSRHDYCCDVQVCPWLSQSKATHRSRVQKHPRSSPKYQVTRWLEATPVQRPRVGQRTTPLSSLILFPTTCNLGLPLEL